MLLFIAALMYLAAGWSCSVALRWNDRTEGVDLLLDTLLWPLVVVFWIRHGR